MNELDFLKYFLLKICIFSPGSDCCRGDKLFAGGFGGVEEEKAQNWLPRTARH